MKKVFSISVIAALAILPMVANAETGDIVAGEPKTAASESQAANAVTAGSGPKYALAVESAKDSTHVATAGYVKGAYNAAIKAINKVSETATSALQADDISTGSANGTIAVDGNDVAVKGLGSAAYEASTAFATSAQGTKADNLDTLVGNESMGTTATTVTGAIAELKGDIANIDTGVQTVTQGATNGTIAVDGTDVAVKGLGSAAFAETTDFDAAGTAAAIENKLDDGASGYDIDANTLKVRGNDVLTGAALTDYAKKTGVTQTITNSVISGTVDTLTTWGTDAVGTAQIAASITGATYAEPTNP
jgi:hypothetical protein